jgi:hypothetical protein
VTPIAEGPPVGHAILGPHRSRKAVDLRIRDGLAARARGDPQANAAATSRPIAAWAESSASGVASAASQ